MSTLRVALPNAAPQLLPQMDEPFSDQYMFQSQSYDGGYDALERAFCFSYYDQERDEFWFQLTLDEIKRIAEGEKMELDIRRV